jgi:class 3 adenylate cyclase
MKTYPPAPLPVDIWKLAQARFNQGDMIGVLDAIDELPDEWRAEPLVQRHEARAYAQCGQPQKARHILQGLLNAAPLASTQLGQVAVSDILALIGRTWKDEWLLGRHTARADSLLAKVIESYQLAHAQAFDTEHAADDQFYAAINIATFAHIAHRFDLARTSARLVLKLCADAEVKNDAWRFASRAEAHALLGHVEEAFRDYAAMAACGGLELRDLCSARKQARLVAEHTSQDRRVFDPAFNLPSIVVFAGHRLDDATRRAPRLPAEVMEPLRAELDRLLAQLKAGISYSSAAAGADIAFLEAMQARGGETHILLSSPETTFRHSNIDNALGAGWGERFDGVLAYARSEQNGGSIMAASPHEPREDSITYTYANLIMSGQAWHRAQTLDLDLHPVAVWDDLPGDGQGGTADFCKLWTAREHQPFVIHSADLLPPSFVSVSNTAPPPSREPILQRTAFRQEIKAILFADVKNFTKLSEDQVELFSRHYLGQVSKLISLSAHDDLQAPLVCNTWGDAFYMVFDTVRDAGRFALRLQQMLAPAPDGAADWQALQLPSDLNIRIALHAGPVFLYSDPVIRNLSFTGRHVSFAARLEPVTKPGQIFASEAFSALAVIDGVQDFHCAYVGQLDAPKHFGTVRAFSVTGVADVPA